MKHNVASTTISQLAQTSHIVSLSFIWAWSLWAVWQKHLRYCLSDGTRDPSTEQVHMRFQNEDIRVVRGGAAQYLWEMFQAETLQGTKGKEWETWKINRVGDKVKLVKHREHWSHMLTMIFDRKNGISLCKLISIVTCIRGHSNKCWSKPPIEARDPPLLYKKEKQVWLYEVDTQYIIINTEKATILRGLCCVWEAECYLMVDSVEGIDNSSVAMLSCHLKGQSGSDHIQWVGAYHCSHPWKRTTQCCKNTCLWLQLHLNRIYWD